MNRRPFNIAALPNLAQEQILTHLPLINKIRLRSVSKKTKEMMSSRGFVNRHTVNKMERHLLKCTEAIIHIHSMLQTLETKKRNFVKTIRERSVQKSTKKLLEDEMYRSIEHIVKQHGFKATEYDIIHEPGDGDFWSVQFRSPAAIAYRVVYSTLISSRVGMQAEMTLNSLNSFMFKFLIREWTPSNRINKLPLKKHPILELQSTSTTTIRNNVDTIVHLASALRHLGPSWSTVQLRHFPDVPRASIDLVTSALQTVGIEVQYIGSTR